MSIKQLEVGCGLIELGKSFTFAILFGILLT